MFLSQFLSYVQTTSTDGRNFKKSTFMFFEARMVISKKTEVVFFGVTKLTPHFVYWVSKNTKYFLNQLAGDVVVRVLF